MKTRIIAIILAVIAAGSAAAYFITKQPKKEEPLKPVIEDFSLTNSDYSKAVEVLGANGEIFLPTDREGLYYTATLKNKIEFYVYTGGKFEKAKYDVKKTKVSLDASNISIPVEITYIDAGGLIVGYGVTTSDMNKDLRLYEYAFVKIAKKSAGYGEGYWLLADFDKSNFYSPDKVYSEIYNYKVGDSKVNTAVNQNTRLIDRNGTYRQDWTMMTDEFIRNLGKSNYFISSRYYSYEETGKRSDIMAWSGAYRPKIVAKDIIGTWFVSDDKGIHYLKKSSDGFNSITKKDDKEKKTVKFNAPYEQYLRSGNYVVNTQTAVMTNLLTGDETELKDIDLTKAVKFSVNKDASRAVFIYSTQEENISRVNTNQKITYYSFDSGVMTETFEEPMLYQEMTGIVWLEGGNSVMTVRATSDDGENTGSVVYTFKAED